ncbi:MAG: hypothetical protein AB7U82_30615 [Blastocatellales bacterium]
MANRTSAIIVDAGLAEAYNAAPKTEQKKALSAMRGVLRKPKPDRIKDPRLSKKETKLFLRINRTLTPEEQQRYEELTEKRLDETLTKSEHAELGELIKDIERIWVDRLRAITELARLRKISPQEMMRRLEIDPRVTVPQN